MAPNRVDLTIRADATPAIGAGHVMRMLSLARAWRQQKSGTVTLAGTVTIPFAADQLRNADAKIRADLPGPAENGVLVVDHYDPCVRAIGAARSDYRLRVLVDDLGLPVPAGFDAVWNPNTYGDADQYPAFAGPVLTGAAHVPVRNDLVPWRGDDRSRVAVMLGGGAVPAGLRQALQSLGERLPEATWLGAGPWVPDGWAIANAARPWDDVSRCGRLITSAGISMWEAAAVGIPVVVLTTTANHARGGAWARGQGVPTVEAVTPREPAGLADDLAAGLRCARPLPRLSDGSGAVSRALASFAGEPRR